MNLKGKHFIVTGGASGLGEATVDALLVEGANVSVLDMNLERANEIAQKKPAQCFAVEADITSEDSITKSVQSAYDKWGRVDGVVNCAGAGVALSTINKKTLEPHDMDSFEFAIRLNLIGTFSVSAKCAALMARNTPAEGDADGERGVIINVASTAAFDGQNGQVAYAASKAGVAGMTIAMARDLGAFGIRAVTIAPGMFATPMTQMLRTPAGQRVCEPLLKAQCFPRDRFGHPDEFAALVVCIARNKFINGETIRLDAGCRMPKL